jgi:hypothetical protein
MKEKKVKRERLVAEALSFRCAICPGIPSEFPASNHPPAAASVAGLSLEAFNDDS